MAYRGWIYLLPSVTQMVIVKYDPKWVISCVLPATTRKITFQRIDFLTDKLYQWTREIDVPDMLISHSFKKPWCAASKTEEYFSLNAIDLSDLSVIKVTPYRLANIYRSGKICFGDLSLDRSIHNLRQAFSMFWGSNFNEDNCPYFDLHAHTCKKRNHEYTTQCSTLGSCICQCCMNVCGCECNCDLNQGFYEWMTTYSERLKSKQYTTKTKFFCGNKYFASNKPTKALFISNKDMKETTSQRNDAQGDSFIIGTAVFNNDIWEIDLGDHTFSLPTYSVQMV